LFLAEPLPEQIGNPACAIRINARDPFTLDSKILETVRVFSAEKDMIDDSETQAEVQEPVGKEAT
jgi:hypothetical protein